MTYTKISFALACLVFNVASTLGATQVPAGIEAQLKEQANRAALRDTQNKRRQALEQEIATLRRTLQEDMTLSPEERTKVQFRLNLLQEDLQALALPASPFSRSLKAIITPGISDAVRKELIDRLPLQTGDTISQLLMLQTLTAVRNYDERLRVQFKMTNDGQTELHISPPMD